MCAFAMCQTHFADAEVLVEHGSDIPQYTNITIQNFHDVSGGSNTPIVTLDGYDSAHMNSVTSIT